MSRYHEIEKLLREAPKRVVTIGTTQKIYIGADTTDQVEKDIQRGLARGETVVENGISRWIEFMPIHDEAKKKANPDLYHEWLIWHKDGNRVKCDKVLHTKGTDGNVDKKILCSVWKDAIEVM